MQWKSVGNRAILVADLEYRPMAQTEPAVLVKQLPNRERGQGEGKAKKGRRRSGLRRLLPVTPRQRQFSRNGSPARLV